MLFANSKSGHVLHSLNGLEEDRSKFKRWITMVDVSRLTNRNLAYILRRFQAPPKARTKTSTTKFKLLDRDDAIALHVLYIL